MAKKMKLVGLALTLTTIVASVCLASCNKDANQPKPTSTTATTQQVQSHEATKAVDTHVDKSMYVASFNSTENFIKRYTDKNFDFNANLPLRLDFTDLLNTLSNGADVLAIKNPELQKLGKLQLLQQLQTQFTAAITKYKSMDQVTVKTMFDKAGIVVDLDNANLTTLLSQLKTSCAQNNNYQVDIDKLVKSLVIKDKDGKVVAFPEAEVKMLQSWSQHFVQACQLNDQLYTVASAKDFDYSKLPASIQTIKSSIDQNTVTNKSAESTITDTKPAK